MGGPGWTDDVLPGFDAPEPPVVRPKSHNQQAKERGVIYARHRANNVKCDHCIDAVASQGAKAVRVASNTRTDKGNVEYLCFYHTTEARHKDQLDGRRVSG